MTTPFATNPAPEPAPLTTPPPAPEPEPADLSISLFTPQASTHAPASAPAASTNRSPHRSERPETPPRCSLQWLRHRPNPTNMEHSAKLVYLMGILSRSASTRVLRNIFGPHLFGFTFVHPDLETFGWRFTNTSFMTGVNFSHLLTGTASISSTILTVLAAGKNAKRLKYCPVLLWTPPSSSWLVSFQPLSVAFLRPLGATTSGTL